MHFNRLSWCFKLLHCVSDKSRQECEQRVQPIYLGGCPVMGCGRALGGLTDRPAMGDDSLASSPMNGRRPSGTKSYICQRFRKRKYSNGNRKAVNHKPKVSYVMLVRQWVALSWWWGKSFLPFRGRIATVIPLTCTLNRQMPFNCQ